MNENDRKLAQLRVTLEARGDGKCISLAMIAEACKIEDFK
jgi:hypothetical protein